MSLILHTQTSNPNNTNNRRNNLSAKIINKKQSFLLELSLSDKAHKNRTLLLDMTISIKVNVRYGHI